MGPLEGWAPYLSVQAGGSSLAMQMPSRAQPLPWQPECLLGALPTALVRSVRMCLTPRRWLSFPQEGGYRCIHVEWMGEQSRRTYCLPLVAQPAPASQKPSSCPWELKEMPRALSPRGWSWGRLRGSRLFLRSKLGPQAGSWALR